MQIRSGKLRVPLRGHIVNESSNALRFRIDGRWEVDIFKEMILRVEADNCGAPEPGMLVASKGIST
ncbi:MAG: hypothetical protein WBE20_16245 [Candidatus Acidiferrales bacterium]